jgi:hypothetical protein
METEKSTHTTGTQCEEQYEAEQSQASHRSSLPRSSLPRSSLPRYSQPYSQPSSQPSSQPEKTIQDLFQWFGKVASDYSYKINENAAENLDIIGKDFKTLYSKVGSILLQGQDSLKMTAQEIRTKTSEELYQTIKVNVIYHRDVCKYIHPTNCTSVTILEEVKKRLVDEGFEVNYVMGENSTHMNIQW